MFPLALVVHGTTCLVSLVVPASHSSICCRVMNYRKTTDEPLRARGCMVISRCDLYVQRTETLEHLFLCCMVATRSGCNNYFR